MTTTAVSNAATIARWNGAEARQWITHADRYDAMLGSFGSRALAAARLSPGDLVVDVGCGTGTTTLEAAWAVGRTGRVIGVDVSAPLLEVATRRVEDWRAAARVTLIRADAQTHPFLTGRADAVISRFGLMLFADPVEAFANLARALRAGGRLAFVTWQAADRNTWFSAPHAALAEHVPVAAPDDSGPCPFSLADPTRVHEILDRAGFDSVRLESLTERAVLGSDVDDVVTFYEDVHGAALRAALDAATVDRIVAGLRERLTPFLTPTGVRMPAAAWLVTATRASA